MRLVDSIASLSLLIIILLFSNCANACRLNSELLKGYARRTVERLLATGRFGSIYWDNEPLSVDSLSKAIGINVTLAETYFRPESSGQAQSDEQKNTIVDASNAQTRPANASTGSGASLIQDIFVSCSIDRDRSYSLSINLELNNPFKLIDVYYELPSDSPIMKHNMSQVNNSSADGSSMRRNGSFKIRLPQSSLLVQLSQKIRYDECLRVNYVQLAPTVNYELECAECNKSEQDFLDKIFTKRMSQLDTELDATLSEKILFALQILVSEQRLDLDMYLD